MITNELALLLYDLIETRGMTAIDYKIENLLESDSLKESYRPILQEIYASQDLDERWAICYEKLGEKDRAEELRTWIATKKGGAKIKAPVETKLYQPGLHQRLTEGARAEISKQYEKFKEMAKEHKVTILRPGGHQEPIEMPLLTNRVMSEEGRSHLELQVTKKRGEYTGSLERLPYQDTVNHDKTKDSENHPAGSQEADSQSTGGSDSCE